MRVLGIHCSPQAAYLTVIEDGAVLSGLRERLLPPAGLETGEGLLECIREVRRVLGQTGVDRVALLLTEANSSPSTERTVLETLIRVAAAEEGTPVELVARPTVRSRLGLPKSGSLGSHVARAAGPKSGHHWNEGRGLAAMAAKAVTS